MQSPEELKYCCVCRNYRRMFVDGVEVLLHRFPMNNKINWCGEEKKKEHFADLQ